MKRVAIHTLGCKVNRFESEALIQAFQEQGWHPVVFQESADLYIVNTCAVTAEAQRQSAQVVRSIVRRSPEALIVAAGCAAQLFPEYFSRISGLDYLYGTGNKSEIPGIEDFLKNPVLPELGFKRFIPPTRYLSNVPIRRFGPGPFFASRKAATPSAVIASSPRPAGLRAACRPNGSRKACSVLKRQESGRLS